MNIPSEEDLLRLINHLQQSVWIDKDITGPRINKWLANFVGKAFAIEDERRIALWLLLNFSYYNENEVKHLCKEVFYNYRHSIIQKGHNFEEYLKNVKFSSLGSPSESSGFILYYFRQNNELATANFADINEVIDFQPKELIFVDDVSLSGSQLERYVRKTREKGNVDMSIKTLALISTDKAKEVCSGNSIELISAINLSKAESIFSNDSFLFNDDRNLLEKTKILCFKYGNIINPKNPLGYDDSQNLIGFFYNTPNNTLPIFWSERNGWYPLFPRYNKLYNDNYSLEKYDLFF